MKRAAGKQTQLKTGCLPGDDRAVVDLPSLSLIPVQCESIHQRTLLGVRGAKEDDEYVYILKAQLLV